MSANQKAAATYKFQVDECEEPGRLRLTVFTHGECTDIIEGPYRFVINKLTSYYDDSLTLRKRS